MDSLVESVYSHEIDKIPNNEKEISNKPRVTLTDKANRLENLCNRRPFLLSHVLLRQNPDNVYTWINYIQLCEHDNHLAIKAFREAIGTIDPQRAFGKLHKLWTKFA